MAKYHQGKFRPLNPSKYTGDPTNIVYRSWWEFRVFSFLDKQSSIIEWGSEEFSIPYRDPFTNKIRRYFPDIKFKAKTKDGSIETILLEVKPKKQTKPPQPMNTRGKPTKKYLNEVHTWGINSSKFKAAEQYCLDRGWKFSLFTEEDLKNMDSFFG